MTETVRGTKKEAEKRLSRLSVEVEDGRRSASRSRSFGELLDEWLDLKKPDLAPKTLELYTGLIEHHLRPTLGDRPLHRLGARDFDQLYGALRARRLSGTTVRKVHLVAKGALSLGVRWGYVAVNPAERSRPPTAQRPQICAPSASEMQKLLAEAADYDECFGVLVRVAASTGARRGEIAALRWLDLDFDAGTVTVARSIDAITTLEKSTKTGGTRVVPVDTATLDRLRAYHEFREQLALSAGCALDPNAFVFGPDVAGDRPFRPDGITHMWTHVRDRCGLPFKFHAIRHFVGTELVAAGVDVRTVADRLGHANPAVTLVFYSHGLGEPQRQAAEVIAGRLSVAAD